MMAKRGSTRRPQVAMRFPLDLLADLRAVSAVTGQSVIDIVSDALRPALATIIKRRKIADLVAKVKKERMDT